MRRNLITTLLAVALTGALLHASMATSAADTPAPSASSPGPILLPPGETPGEQPVAFMLELEAGSNIAAIEQAVTAKGAIVLYHTNFVYRGIAVSTTTDGLAKLETIAGVKAVHNLPSKQRLRTRTESQVAPTTAWMAPAVTTDPNSTTTTPSDMSGGAVNGTAFLTPGAPVRIGVIDSGVDYTHATFGGPGTPAAYDANNPATVEAGSFPTVKINGIDLVGDGYDADGVVGSVTPAPDGDPLDCRLPAGSATLNRGSHGTFVAAIAAGAGVAGGETYPGPYDETVAGVTFDVPPGIAPNATIYALKVFGCRGSTAFLGHAIEQAIDPNGDGDYSDRLVDVLTIAIGSPFGSDDDPDVLAVNKAVAVGVTVVVAMGDSGNVFYATSSPGSATGALTVGAVGMDGEILSVSSRGPQRGNTASKPDMVALGEGISGAASGTGIGATTMTGTSAAAAQVAGAAALTLEYHPTWTPVQVKAALVGTATPLRDIAGTLYPVSLAGAGKLNLAPLKDLTTLMYLDGEDAPVGISFGAPRATGLYNDVKNLTIYNDTGTARSVVLNTTTAVSENGVSVSVPAGAVALPPNSATIVPVNLSVNPTLLDETPDTFTPPLQGVLDRYALFEHSGLIQLTTAGGATTTRVRAAHTAAESSLNFYIDGQQLGGTLSPPQVGNYEFIAPGRHTVSILPGGADFGTETALIERDITFESGQDYTLAVLGCKSDLDLLTIKIEPQTQLMPVWSC
jgi:subtilisin family serine protease